MITNKLKNVREKDYILPGKVSNLTGYFAAPKGIGDIWTVYDELRSGLNKILWAPNFWILALGSCFSLLDGRYRCRRNVPQLLPARRHPKILWSRPTIFLWVGIWDTDDLGKVGSMSNGTQIITLLDCERTFTGFGMGNRGYHRPFEGFLLVHSAAKSPRP